MIVNLRGKASGWPVGARLRFRLDAELQVKYQHLRGSRVEVLGPPHLVSPRDGRTTWDVRQRVWADAFGGPGWADPQHLEPRPDEPARPQMLATAEGDYDPIQSAMDSNPGLTREKAEEMAAALGF